MTPPGAATAMWNCCLKYVAKASLFESSLRSRLIEVSLLLKD
jgi:hypothetical protein